MQRYLLVLDADLLAPDEKLGLEPANYPLIPPGRGGGCLERGADRAKVSAG
jgi:hypothetical protein